jgi:outer membrane biosynthesis protein TonB
MFQSRPLQYALLFSLAIHAALLTIFSLSRIKDAAKLPRHIEVTYAAPKPKKVAQPVQPPIKDSLQFKERKLPKDLDILSKTQQKSPMTQEIRTVDKSRDVIQLGRKQSPSIKSFGEDDKRITVPLLKSEKITNPKYLSYNDTIRQKIRQKAFNYVDHPDFKQGEVYLTFILDSSGVLKDVKIIDSKTHANDYLRSVGLKSVRGSAPFPPFPKDLNYPDLTFNIVISFQTEPEK